MRRLIAWVNSFSRNDKIVNQAVRQLTEIAQQRVAANASVFGGEQAQGYQRARLKQTVRQYLDSLENGRGEMQHSNRRRLISEILDRLVEHQPIVVQTTDRSRISPRQAA